MGTTAKRPREHSAHAHDVRRLHNAHIAAAHLLLGGESFKCVEWNKVMVAMVYVLRRGGVGSDGYRWV